MGPDHVTLVVQNEQTGEEVKKKVYVTDVSGTRTLDLYSGWDPDSGQHKIPLKALPSKVCTLTNLQRLWVSHNCLSSLPPQLNQLVHLKELFLHRNNFDEFPTSLCSLPKLEILWLSCNKIMYIPDEIAQLTALKRLHLDSNFIKEVTSSLCQLVNLEVLYLNENTIHVLSKDIGNLTNLKRFYLQHNKISELPDGVCQLKSLKMFYLDFNELRHVKREFSLFQSEQESKGSIISLKGNPIMQRQSKMKLSLNMHPSHSQGSMKTRRYSDQYESDIVSRRPTRVSLPSTHPLESLRPSDSVPVNMQRLEQQYQSRHPFTKADTLPRRNTVSMVERGTLYNEH